MVVIDITAADEATATQAATALGRLWLSSGPSSPWHTPGRTGASPSVPTPTCAARLWPAAVLAPAPAEPPPPAVPHGRVATASTPAIRSLRARYSTWGNVPE
ncbi:DUF6207 family protein [Streptomyces tubercidicus]